MKEHIEINHKEEIEQEKSELTCTFSGCNKLCKSKASLYYHFISSHEEKRHFCIFCDKAFIFKNLLTKHTKSKHNKEFYCKICGKDFTRPGSLNTHIQRVHEDFRARYGFT